MPSKKQRSLNQPQKGPGVLSISENTGFRPAQPVYRHDSRPNNTGHNQGYQNQKPKSQYDRTKDEYRSTPQEPGPFSGVSHIQSPQRPVRNSSSQNAWGKPKAPAWGTGSGGSHHQSTEISTEDDWGDSVGFPGLSASTSAAPAPPPKTNVWQQRMEFVQGAMPSSEMEEEQMLQAALKLSCLQEEEEKLRYKLDEEERVADTGVAESSLYMFNNGAAPLNIYGQREVKQKSAPEWSAPPPVSAVPTPVWPKLNTGNAWGPPAQKVDPAPQPKPKDQPPSSWGLPSASVEQKPAVSKGFARGIGRGSRHSSRSVSASSDATSEPGVVQHPSQPPHKFTEPLPPTVYKQKPVPVVHVPKDEEDFWASDCDDASSCDDASERPTARAAHKAPVISSVAPVAPDQHQQQQQPWGNSARTEATLDGSQKSDVGSSKNSNSVIPTGELQASSVQTEIMKSHNKESVKHVPEPDPAAPSEPDPQAAASKMNGLPSESELAFGRGRVRRTYGPRARMRKTTPPTEAASKLPVSVSMPTSQPIHKAPTSEHVHNAPSYGYAPEDTTEKLRGLCNQLPETSRIAAEIPKKNIFSRPNKTNDTDITYAKSDMPKSVSDVFSGALPQFPVADIGKPVSSNGGVNGFGQTNGLGIQGLVPQMSGLSLCSSIWAPPVGTSVSVSDSWAAVGLIPQSKVQQPRPSSTSSETSECSPGSSPEPPQLTDAHGQNTTNPTAGINNPTGDLGSYLGYSHPYMNMQMPVMMPQMYGMYQGMPMAPAANMGGMMSFGVMPSMMPHVPVGMPTQQQYMPTDNGDNGQQTNGNNARHTPSPGAINGNQFLTGMMSQYGSLPNGANNMTYGSLGSQDQGSNTNTTQLQPPRHSPPIMTPTMPMMPGMMPFLPTMPLVPQQYGNLPVGPKDAVNNNGADTRLS